MSKVKLIMLVDDNKMDNYFHKIVIKKANFSGDVVVFQYAEDALSFLETTDKKVDLILLDINMPRMNGFEFLEQYELLAEEKRAKAIVVMLTTSLNPADEVKAKSYPDVKLFLNKPLSPDTFQEIIRDFFEESV